MGRLARDGLHPDQNPDVPVGAWCDAVWSAYSDMLLSVRSAEHLDALNETWDEIIDVPPPAVEQAPVDENGRRRPTDAERAAWGTSAKAQAGNAHLMAMMGGMPPAGGG